MDLFNLIVSSALSDLAEPDPLEIARVRFLEYTEDSIKAQLRTLSAEAVAVLRSWPSLIMEEGRGDERAFLGRIREISVGPADLTVRFDRIPTQPPLLNADIWRMRAALDIEQFEFSRHHWAVKSRDLLGGLEDAGVALDLSAQQAFRHLPLPAPGRSELFGARDRASAWGHTEIDDFLLEAGVAGLRAGREVGSRRDRANAILRFVLEKPSEVTAENSLLSAFFVRSTTEVEPGSADEEALEETVPEVSPSPGPTVAPRREETQRSPNRVFVVHGRDEAARGQVAEFLRRVGLAPIVLHEQPSMGRHLLTKFVDEADLVTFAVIVMTADDVGGLSATELAPRARQNVILELGYFLAHLGQPRVCALVAPGLETPSDFDGIVYIRMAEEAVWQGELERELRAAGMPLHEVNR